jgi:hypothetical protein
LKLGERRDGGIYFLELGRGFIMSCWVQNERLTECEEELLDSRQVFRIDVHWDKCMITRPRMLEIIDGALLSRPQVTSRVGGWR